MPAALRFFCRLLLSSLWSLVLLGCLKPPGIRYPALPSLADGALHIVVFGLGQADALLVLYKGRSLLIDVGADRSYPDKTLHHLPKRIEALSGSRHLDYVLITHYHDDHVGRGGRVGSTKRKRGLFALLEQRRIGVGVLLHRGFWRLGPMSATARNFEIALRRWVADGIVGQARATRVGDSIFLGKGLDIKVVAAAGNGLIDRLLARSPRLLQEYPPSENDYSVAVKLTFGDFEFFTAGDLSGRNALRRFGPVRESYNNLESRIAAAVGGVEVYRVSHHGSSLSSNPCLVATLSPQVSVISSGTNSHGHPHPEIYARLKSVGDVRITSGAAEEVFEQVAGDIVGDDIDIVVAPDGKRFWVNGEAYLALTQEQEESRQGNLSTCRDPLEEPHVLIER